MKPRALSLMALACAATLAGAATAVAAPVIGADVAPVPQRAVIDAYYYHGRHYPYRYKGHYYNYYWNHHYYMHREHRNGHWHYY
ncbi:MAG: hypothetical protein KGL52_00735 [Rhodospirillales bacterium]|jgi:hypothetical protein|nr:hypothetical protein [Rhodospirillales bacterium]